MTSIAFIGLGIMGLPMAVNLRDAGHDVTGVVRPGGDTSRAGSAGVPVTDDAAAAVAAADIVITMLPDAPDVRAVVDAFLPALREGTLLIDMSTISAEVTTRLGADVAAAGSSMIDAPVSGGEAGAIEGVLSIMVGGEALDVARATPVFEAMGKTIVHVGPLGAGQLVKAANQMVVAGNIQILAEAITFLRAQGVDDAAALDVIGGGLAGSTVLERKRAAFLSGEFAPGFRLQLHAKDLGIVEAAAAQARLALPLTAAVTQLVRSSVARGDGQLDHAALLKLTAELNGSPESR